MPHSRPRVAHLPRAEPCGLRFPSRSSTPGACRVITLNGSLFRTYGRRSCTKAEEEEQHQQRSITETGPRKDTKEREATTRTTALSCLSCSFSGELCQPPSVSRTHSRIEAQKHSPRAACRPGTCMACDPRFHPTARLSKDCKTPRGKARKKRVSCSLQRGASLPRRAHACAACPSSPRSSLERGWTRGSRRVDTE